ncbi:fibrobacter succinogenes major paralogous domain-containing protein [Flavobacterium sp. UBA6031]|uniref:fibrobacter succinogenes major paralogous domain-containing protein n=1 Tax=Flavobacterium sp. UBA6031 TaxID=1946551 RepID=UPI0025B9899E|nr:fibrobacter succinogenes major paralogous domain-containing protein [Flavobacterium sp. UBA6031]
MKKNIFCILLVLVVNLLIVSCTRKVSEDVPKVDSTVIAVDTVTIENNSSINTSEDISTIKDINNNIYHTIKIGNQTWMLENLSVTSYRNGDQIPNIENDSLWGEATQGAYCNYNNVLSNGKHFGRLYNALAAMDIRYLAPVGWHIPTVDEWECLKNYLAQNGYGSGQGEKRLHETSVNNSAIHTVGAYIETTKSEEIAKSLASKYEWKSSSSIIHNSDIIADLSKNNTSGFTALPSGYRFGKADFGECKFVGINNCTRWWALKDNGSLVYTVFMDSNNSYLNINAARNDEKNNLGYAIRCIKDE